MSYQWLDLSVVAHNHHDDRTKIFVVPTKYNGGYGSIFDKPEAKKKSCRLSMTWI